MENKICAARCRFVVALLALFVAVGCTTDKAIIDRIQHAEAVATDHPDSASLLRLKYRLKTKLAEANAGNLFEIIARERQKH